MTMVIKYETLSLSQQVIERQQGHASKISGYIEGNADISDSTGFLLGFFDPLSKAAIMLATQACGVLEEIERATAVAIGDTAADVADADGKVKDIFSQLIGELGQGGSGSGSYPDLGGPTLPTASESAPDDYGSVDSYFWQKRTGSAETISGSVSDARSLVNQVSQWGGTAAVSEVSDASSFLVSPNAPDNFVQDLRWSAGTLLGSIDWVAEQFVGFSILDRCVYHPLAGDWQGIYRASEAWKHAGAASMAIGANHAGLVATTPATWQGESGNSFRLAMTGATAASMGLSTAFELAGGYVKTISTVCKLACTGIGMALDFIATKLLKMAANASVPIIGWAKQAYDMYDDVNSIIKKVRLAYTIIETIESAINDFIEAKTSILAKLEILEDLLQGGAASVAV